MSPLHLLLIPLPPRDGCRPTGQSDGASTRSSATGNESGRRPPASAVRHLNVGRRATRSPCLGRRRPPREGQAGRQATLSKLPSPTPCKPCGMHHTLPASAASTRHGQARRRTVRSHCGGRKTPPREGGAKCRAFSLPRPPPPVTQWPADAPPPGVPRRNSQGRCRPPICQNTFVARCALFPPERTATPRDSPEGRPRPSPLANMA